MAESARVYPLRRELPPEPPSQQPSARAPRPAEPLWREALGRRLRALRLDKGEILTETAGRAGISPQYLSEVERGRKEPSSEMIAALAGALDTTLIGLAEQVAEDLRRQQGIAPVPSTPSIPSIPSIPSTPSSPDSRASGPVMLRLAA